MKVVECSPEVRGRQNPRKIEQSVEAKRAVAGAPFESEARSTIRGSETHPLPLQQFSVGPADGNVLRMAAGKFGCSRQLQQPPRPQRESSVSNVMPILELRPGRPDIIEIQERVRPPAPIQHEPVPLDHKDVREIDMIDQPAQDEVRILP